MMSNDSGNELQKIAANATLRSNLPSKTGQSKPMERSSTPKTNSTNNNNNNGKQLMRDISFKPRFRYNYGFDEKFYDHALKYKDAWQDKLFYVDESMMIEEYQKGESTIKQFPLVDASGLNIDDLQTEKFTDPQVRLEFFLGDDLLDLKLTRDKQTKRTQLKFSESVELNDSINRNGTVLNVGAHVTSMSWLPQQFNEKECNFKYLAVSVINNPNGIEDSINNPQLSVFHKTLTKESLSIKSGLQIWKYDLSQNKFELSKFIVTTSIGACSSISWLPISIQGDAGILGILCGTFTDGRLHLFKITQNTTQSPQFSNLIKSSFYYEMNDPSNTDVDRECITCYDFLGYEKIIVGLSAGSIAEYILPYNLLQDEDESNITIPSFVQSLAETPITAISIANPDDEKYFILINTSGSQSFVIEYNNFQQGRVESFPTNTLLKPIYNHNLKVFVTSDAWDSISYSFVRHPHEKPSSLLKLDGIVSSLHLSEVLGHPLNISGTTFGEIHILNIARKILNGAKATNKLLIPLRLWKLELGSDNKTLELSGDLEIVQTDKSTKIALTPPEVVISSIAWNENLHGSSIYAAATISGLLILERLDPKYN